jgi:hypothetical protein
MRNSTIVDAAIKMIVERYQRHTPTAVKILNSLEVSFGITNIKYDHLAFRTFGTKNLGIPSTGKILTELGFRKADDYTFPEKKLRATWYAPPTELYDVIPRIFLSEIKIEELSKKSQDIIVRQIFSDETNINHSSLLTCILGGVRPWSAPNYSDYQTLAQESEYAAWVLAQGYSLNHYALSLHRMKRIDNNQNKNQDKILSSLGSFTEALMNIGYTMNQEGSLIKISPDKLLLQSSTVEDMRSVKFADGEARLIPGAYVEFVERKLKSEHVNIAQDKVREWHRRDGFETVNADKIFESTDLRTQIKEALL